MGDGVKIVAISTTGICLCVAMLTIPSQTELLFSLSGLLGLLFGVPAIAKKMSERNK